PCMSQYPKRETPGFEFENEQVQVCMGTRSGVNAALNAPVNDYDMLDDVWDNYVAPEIVGEHLVDLEPANAHVYNVQQGPLMAEQPVHQAIRHVHNKQEEKEDVINGGDNILHAITTMFAGIFHPVTGQGR
ncbi:hypothetical protein QFC21_006942, partial [Naganishia friedmannii]